MQQLISTFLAVTSGPYIASINTSSMSESATSPTEIVQTLDELALEASHMSFDSVDLAQSQYSPAATVDRAIDPTATTQVLPTSDSTLIRLLRSLFGRLTTLPDDEPLLPVHSCHRREPNVPQTSFDVLMNFWTFIAEKIIGPCYNNRGIFNMIVLIAIGVLLGSVLYYTDNFGLLIILGRVFVCFWWSLLGGGMGDMAEICQA